MRVLFACLAALCVCSEQGFAISIGSPGEHLINLGFRRHVPVRRSRRGPDIAWQVALPMAEPTACNRRSRSLEQGDLRRRGRVAEGNGLLNRHTLSRRIEGSNPSVSAIISRYELKSNTEISCGG